MEVIQQSICTPLFGTWCGGNWLYDFDWAADDMEQWLGAVTAVAGGGQM